jgi:hypothetical protein
VNPTVVNQGKAVATATTDDAAHAAHEVYEAPPRACPRTPRSTPPHGVLADLNVVRVTETRPSCRESKLGRETIGSQSPSLWRSQLCHAFREPGGHTRSQEDTKKIQFEYRRNRADTTGHERTRDCAGSGPCVPNHEETRCGAGRMRHVSQRSSGNN